MNENENTATEVQLPENSTYYIVPADKIEGITQNLSEINNALTQLSDNINSHFQSSDAASTDTLSSLDEINKNIFSLSESVDSVDAATSSNEPTAVTLVPDQWDIVVDNYQNTFTGLTDIVSVALLACIGVFIGIGVLLDRILFKEM